MLILFGNLSVRVGSATCAFQFCQRVPANDMEVPACIFFGYLADCYTILRFFLGLVSQQRPGVQSRNDAPFLGLRPQAHETSLLSRGINALRGALGANHRTHGANGADGPAGAPLPAPTGVQEEHGILASGLSAIKHTLERFVPGAAAGAEGVDDASAGARAAWARADAAKKEVATAEARAEEAREQAAEMQQQADEAR